jgi:hypothetical protein
MASIADDSWKYMSSGCGGQGCPAIVSGPQPALTFPMNRMMPPLVKMLTSNRAMVKKINIGVNNDEVPHSWPTIGDICDTFDRCRLLQWMHGKAISNLTAIHGNRVAIVAHPDGQLAST